MSVLLNNNSGLVVQSTANTSSRTESVPYGTATGISDGTGWRYSHAVNGTITLGTPGTYKFSCNIGEWTVTLPSSGTTTVNVSKTAQISALLTVSIQLTCQANNGVMNVTGTYTQIVPNESTIHTRSGNLVLDVFEPVSIVLNLPQQSWSPITTESDGGDGWYLDGSSWETIELHCASTVPLAVVIDLGISEQRFVFNSMTASVVDLVNPESTDEHMTFTYDKELDEFVCYTLGQLIVVGATILTVCVTPLCYQKVLLLDNKAVSNSNSTSIYTTQQYLFSSYKQFQYGNYSLGVDAAKKQSETQSAPQLLTASSNILSNENHTTLLRGSDAVATSFRYNITGASQGALLLFGSIETPSLTLDAFASKIEVQLLDQNPIPPTWASCSFMLQVLKTSANI